MMTKLVRIGRDAEMKYTPQGTALLVVSVVYDVGFGDKKKGQWVKLAMFGARAEKLVGHFTKGKQIVATMDDVQARAWNDKTSGEAKCSLEAKLVDFDFAGGGDQQNQQPQQPQQGQQGQQVAQQYRPQQAPAQQQNTSYGQQAPQQQVQYAPVDSSFDDDITF